MYCAQYSDGEQRFCHYALRFDKVIVESAKHPVGWWTGYETAMERLLATTEVDFACRILLTGGQLRRVLLLILPDTAQSAGTKQEEYLVGDFLRLNGIVEDSVEICHTREQYDACMQDFPTARLQGGKSIGEAYGHVLACVFPAFPHLTEILSEGLYGDNLCGYQANVCRYSADPEDARLLRKQLYRIQNTPDIPAAAVTLQEQATQNLARAGALVDEILGAGTPSVSQRQKNFLQRLFAASSIRAGYPPPFQEPEDAEVLEDMSGTGRHASCYSPLTAFEKSVQAVDNAALRALLTWRPPASWTEGLLSNCVDTNHDAQSYLHRIEQRLAALERAARPGASGFHEIEELKKAMGITRIDPPSVCIKARTIAETIVQRIYQETFTGQKLKPLENMISDLEKRGGVLPATINTYLHAVRILGNKAVHPQADSGAASKLPPLTEADVEMALLMTLSLVEWYLQRDPA